MKKIIKWLLILILVAAILAPVISNGRSVGDILDNIKDNDVKEPSTLVGDDTPVVDSHLAAAGWQLFFTFESDENGVLNSNCEDPGVYSFVNGNQGEYYFVFKENYYDPYKVTGAFVASYNYNRFMFRTEHVSSVDIKPIVEMNGIIIPNTVYCAVYYNAGLNAPDIGDTEEYLTFSIGDHELKYLNGMKTWAEVATLNEDLYVSPEYCEYVLYQGRQIFLGEDVLGTYKGFVPASYSLGKVELNSFYLNDNIIYTELYDIYDFVDYYEWVIIDEEEYVYFENKALLLDGNRVTVETFSFNQRYITSDNIVYYPPVYEEPEILEFTIDDYDPFEFEAGMNWDEIFDIYEGFSLYNDYVCYEGWVLTYENGEKISVTDELIGGHFIQGEKYDPDLESFWFTVGSTRYVIEEEMDWFSFVDSFYASPSNSLFSPFYICDDLHIHCNSTDMVIYNEYDELVEVYDFIEKGGAYYLGDVPS